MILWSSPQLFATEFEVDGIWYEVTKEDPPEVQVYKPNGVKYEGAIMLPEQVEYNGKDYTLTAIKMNAFGRCSDLTSIKLPETIKKIGGSAFVECTKLESINLPASISTIEDRAFESCESLTRIEFDSGSSLTTIGASLFFHCTSLEEVILPSTVTSIDMQAFEGCSTLKSIELPSSIKRIGNHVFYECTSLESIIIPNSVDKISWGTFMDCVSLNSVTLPESLTTIDANAFKNSAIESIVLPKKVINILSEAFKGCDKLTSVTVKNEEPCYVQGEGVFDESVYENAVLKVPAGTKQKYETASVWKNFMNIKAEGEGPFEVDGIWYEIISQTPLEVQVYKPEGVKYKGDITLPEKVVYEGKEYTLTALKDGAFAQCGELTSVSLPETIRKIGSSTFVDCVKLQSINLPASIESLGYYSFGGCTSLTKIEFAPESKLTEIEKSMFYDCTALEVVKLPSSVTQIGSQVFGNCKSLKSIELPSSIEVLEAEIFKNCSNLQNIEIPNSVEKISREAFYGCSSLSSVVLPESLVWIYGSAFEGCAIESITIPAKVRYILSNVFKGCDKLMSITAEGEKPCDIYDDDAFDENTYKNATLNVPSGAEQAYKTADGWKNFVNIEAEVEEEVWVDQPEKYILGVGVLFTIEAHVVPADSPQTVTWSTSDAKVATVNENGKVTSVGAGHATITATSVGGKTAACEVTVIEIELNPTSITGKVGDEVDIEAVIKPADLDEDVIRILNIRWYSNDDKVASVERNQDMLNNTVVLKSTGTAEVVCAWEGEYVRCNVTVESEEVPVEITKFEITATEVSGYEGEGEQLGVEVVTDPADAEVEITWKSSNDAVASVDGSGYVSFKGEGKAVITASCGDKTSECEVTVTEKPSFVPITSLTLSADDVVLPLNFTYSLFGIVTPADATYQSLEWSTSNGDVARVYEGVVYGIVPGEAVITARTTDGTHFSASCHFTIVDPSGIGDAERDGIKVIAANGAIRVMGASAGAVVEVYNMAGSCVAVKTIESSVEELPIAASGVYLVRVDNKAYKVVL